MDQAVGFVNRVNTGWFSFDGEQVPISEYAVWSYHFNAGDYIDRGRYYFLDRGQYYYLDKGQYNWLGGLGYMFERSHYHRQYDWGYYQFLGTCPIPEPSTIGSPKVHTSEGIEIYSGGACMIKRTTKFNAYGWLLGVASSLMITHSCSCKDMGPWWPYLRNPRPKYPILVLEYGSFDCSLLDGQLLAKSQILQDQIASADKQATK